MPFVAIKNRCGCYVVQVGAHQCGKGPECPFPASNKTTVSRRCFIHELQNESDFTKQSCLQERIFKMADIPASQAIVGIKQASNMRCLHGSEEGAIGI